MLSRLARRWPATSPLRGVVPPSTSSRPRLVYDDDCGFCTWAALFVARRSDVELVGYGDLSATQRLRLPPDYERCAYLLDGERRYDCGRAMEEAFLRAYPELEPLAELARRVPYYDAARESAYRRIANNRGLFGRVLSR